jgi:hypothetical protein
MRGCRDVFPKLAVAMLIVSQSLLLESLAITNTTFLILNYRSEMAETMRPNVASLGRVSNFPHTRSLRGEQRSSFIRV